MTKQDFRIHYPQTSRREISGSEILLVIAGVLIMLLTLFALRSNSCFHGGPCTLASYELGEWLNNLFF